MENDKRYNEAVAKIRALEPVLENADTLTAGIMARIGELSGDNGRHRLLAAGRVSAAAAAVMLALLAGEIFRPAQTPPTTGGKRADIRELLQGYEGMQTDEIVGSIAERRKKSEERRDALRLRSEIIHNK